MDDTQQSEKKSKNCENIDTRVANSEKDENAISDSVKMKENDEYKNIEEITNDEKSRTYI